MLRQTKHYVKRLQERCITDNDIAAALCGIKISHHNGSEEKYLDRKRRTYVVVKNGVLITAMRLKPKQMRLIIERSKNREYSDYTAILDRDWSTKGHRINCHEKFIWEAYVFE